MKESSSLIVEEEQIEAATNLVTREVKRKKAAKEATLQKAKEIAHEIGAPTEQLLKESTIEAAQMGIELTKELQQLVVADEREAGENGQKEEAATSEADASEGTQGNTDSLHTINVIEIESSSASPSYSTSTSDSFDLDDVPLKKIYTSINKSLSPSTKLKKKPSDETYEPLYPSILERIGEMSQMRIDVCARLPADHPLQPPVIKPFNFVPADAEVIGEQVGLESVNINESSSSHPKSPTQSSEPSVIENLVNQYSGELPGVESNQEKASRVPSDEVTLESPNKKHQTYKQRQPPV